MVTLSNETINAARLALISAVAEVRSFDGTLELEETAKLLETILRLEGAPDLYNKLWHNPTLYDKIRKRLRRIL